MCHAVLTLTLGRGKLSPSHFSHFAHGERQMIRTSLIVAASRNIPAYARIQNSLFEHTLHLLSENLSNQ